MEKVLSYKDYLTPEKIQQLRNKLSVSNTNKFKNYKMERNVHQVEIMGCYYEIMDFIKDLPVSKETNKTFYYVHHALKDIVKILKG